MPEIDESKLKIALNARRRRDEAEKRVASKKKKEEEAKAAAKKAEEERKKAEKAQREIKDERDILIKLAEVKQESKSTRAYYAAQGFFDLLNLFDRAQEDGSFKEKYNSLRDTENVAKSLLACAVYNEETDMVCISGASLRKMIDDLIQKNEDAISAAKEKLDLAWEEILKSEKAGQETVAEENISSTEEENKAAVPDSVQ